MMNAAVISALARSLMAGELTVAGAHARAMTTLGVRWRWLGSLARRYVRTFQGQTRPAYRDVFRFLQNDSGVARARRLYGDQIQVAVWIAEPPRMLPVAAATAWPIPAIETTADLAKWLQVGPSHLEWFADWKGLNHRSGRLKLGHYHYQIVEKRSGGVRMIESPKAELKAMQRRILAEILDRIPAHAAAHGFVKGRSIVSFATPHVGQRVLLRLDLKDFFPSYPATRAHALFRTLGYPDPVAALLAGLCTNAVPLEAWEHPLASLYPTQWRESQTLYARPHLPQGAPTSPAIANLTAYRLDCRLTGLASRMDAVYTRYADDLAFSGGEEFGRAVERFSNHAAAIAFEEGLFVNHHKTRVMRHGVRQHLAGIVVNEKPSLQRKDLELLEAILTNCVTHGPTTQNRAGHADFRAHLEGRIGFVAMVDRTKGQRLRAVFDRIDWAR